MTRAWDGMLLVDKPSGPTSHDVVAAVRKATHQPRIGHTGTLDPPATGLLVLLLGSATRLADYVPSAPKEYAGTFRLGVTTRTDDLAGAVVSRYDGDLPAWCEIESAALRLVGEGWQVPPAVSARRVSGERLYRAARRGVVLDAPPSRIDVASFEVAPTDDASTWSFAASVSSGTYIRGLVRDLGSALGCGAAVASLRRTGIGPLSLADALAGGASPLDPAVLARGLVPLDAVPLTGGCVMLDDDDASRFRHGRKLAGGASGCPDGVVAVRDRHGKLLGMARAESESLAPRVVLAPPGAVAALEDAVIPSVRSSS